MSVLVFFISLIITFIIILPIKPKAKMSYNILKNKGKIKLYLFKWNFLTLKFKIKSKYIMLTTKKGKNILIPFSSDNKINIEYYDLAYIFIDKTTINTLKFSVAVGKEDDPFKTALMYGAVQVLSSILFSVLKTKKLATIVSNKIIPVYNKDSGTIYISSSLTFTIADYLWGISLYLLKIKKVGRRYETR